jgi:dipeptide/tripeptide permease
MTDLSTPKPKFPATFWTANTIELFERAAYYSMASFMVIYLKESLGMTPSFATFLNGTVLWGIIYFMPILGAIVMTLGMFVMAPRPYSSRTPARRPSCSV